MAYAANGKTLEGMTQYVANYNPNYTGFTFFDDNHANGRDV
jgi:hypothetical protein